jgi:hypothetical protein
MKLTYALALALASLLGGSLADSPANIGTGVPASIAAVGGEGDLQARQCTGWVCNNICCPYNWCCARACCLPAANLCGADGSCYRAL